MSQKFANNAGSRLVGSLAIGATSLTVESATADLFPVVNTTDWLSLNDWFKAVIQDDLGNFEIIYVGVRAVGSGLLSNIQRGREGTAARAWSAGAVVGLRLTAADYEGVVNIKSTNNIFSGTNQFTQPVQASVTGSAATATVASSVVDGAVSTSKLVDGAVATSKLADGAVNAAKLADEAVTTQKLANASVTLQKTSTEVLDRLIPAGLVAWFGRNTAPTGWLKANGAVVPQASYAALFAAIGTTFNTGGEVAGSFRLPDLRGEFLRGWDDGRNADPGRIFGSAQAQAIQAHAHGLNDGNSVIGGPAALSGSLGGGSVLGVSVTTIAPTGGPETRPRNVALLACIKF